MILFDREPHISSGVLCVMQTCVMAAEMALTRRLLMMTRSSKGCMSSDVWQVFGLGVVDVACGGFEI